MLSTSTPKRSFSVSSSSSSVQSAATITPTKQYVVKLFRPDKTLKLKREILILKHLADGPNIIRFVDVILDPETGSPGIVLERVGNTDWKEFYANMGYQDVRFWIRELCRALAFTHQHGIIHRDVKPQNICIDPVARKLTLIDYGLADFYVPGKELNLRVASRFYKPPEILVGNRYYDYSFDMWSDVFFKGEDDLDQLRQIVHVLGRRALHQYLGEYNLSPRLPQDLLGPSNHSMSSSTMATSSSASSSISPSYKQDPIEWFEFVDWGNGETARDMALQVVGGLLVFDHRERWTAEECLQHPFFRDLEESSPEVEVEEEEILVDVAPNVREDGATLNSRVSDASLDSSEGEVVVVKE
ncbi:casein kinase II [Obelidium mucronatum]|nr:casein kinase II [Obelidium mucronatum]